MSGDRPRETHIIWVGRFGYKITVSRVIAIPVHLAIPLHPPHPPLPFVEPVRFTANPVCGQPTPPPSMRGGFPPQRANTNVHPEVPPSILTQPLWHPPPLRPPSRAETTSPPPTRLTPRPAHKRPGSPSERHICVDTYHVGPPISPYERSKNWPVSDRARSRPALYMLHRSRHPSSPQPTSLAWSLPRVLFRYVILSLRPCLACCVAVI